MAWVCPAPFRRWPGPIGCRARKSVSSASSSSASTAYVRSEWGNKAPEVKPETVARIRAELGNRTAPWTAEELLKIGQ